MIDNFVLFYIVVGLVGLLVGVAKGGLDGTIGALATPLMLLVLPDDPAERVVGVVLPILMFTDVFAVASHWGRWKFKMALLLLPGAIVGVSVGTFLITNAPTRSLRLILGIIVLVFVLYKAFEKRILGAMQYQPRNWHGVGAGGIAGFSSSLAHIGGPPVSIYLLMQDLPPRVYVATSAVFFFILNWIKFPYYLYIHLFDWARVKQVAVVAAPMAIVGVLVGRLLVDKIDKDLFVRIVVGILAVVAVWLIVG
jgi:uncharacterized membrane protein YfcA